MPSYIEKVRVHVLTQFSVHIFYPLGMCGTINSQFQWKYKLYALLNIYLQVMNHLVKFQCFSVVIHGKSVILCFWSHFRSICWPFGPAGGRYFWPGPEYFWRVLLANEKKMTKWTTTSLTQCTLKLLVFSNYTTPRGINTAITWMTHTYHGTKGWSKSWFLIFE